MENTVASIGVALAVATLTLVSDPVDRTSTVRELEQRGYGDIEIVGWSPLACPEWSFYATEYRAVDETKQTIRAVRCVGKSSEVRHVFLKKETND